MYFQAYTYAVQTILIFPYLHPYELWNKGNQDLYQILQEAYSLVEFFKPVFN